MLNFKQATQSNHRMRISVFFDLIFRRHGDRIHEGGAFDSGFAIIGISLLAVVMDPR